MEINPSISSSIYLCIVLHYLYYLLLPLMVSFWAFLFQKLLYHFTLASGVQKGQYLTTTWTNLPAVISLRKTCIHFILGFHQPHAICSSEIASLPEISPLNLKSHNSSRFDIIFMFLDTLSDQQFSTSSCHASFSLNRKHKLFCVC